WGHRSLSDLSSASMRSFSAHGWTSLAAARVLAQAPRVILADEPTGRLDHTTGGRVLDALLTAAHATGAALVITTHDPAVAARLTVRRTMREGRLLPADVTATEPAQQTTISPQEHS
ncbi:hypothetical protein AB0K74_36480, partial [Streptomyces sp. NPDC056159]